MMDEARSHSPGFFVSLILLLIGAALFFLAGQVAENFTENLNFTAIPLAPLYGAPLAAALWKSPEGRSKALTLLFWITLWFAAVVFLHAVLLFVTYGESDTGGLRQQWVPLFTAPLGAAGTMLIVAAHRWGRRVRHWQLVMLAAVAAVFLTFLGHDSFAILVPDAVAEDEWPYNLPFFGVLWQVAMAPFLALLPDRKSLGAGKRGKSGGPRVDPTRSGSVAVRLATRREITTSMR